jgi:hypothetical protein
MKVVCNGVTSKILPGLNDTYVRRFNRTPVGPHPVASFEVCTHILISELAIKLAIKASGVLV